MSVKCGSCGEFMADVTRITDSHERLVCANKSCRLSNLSPTRISTPQKFGAELIKVLGLEGQRVTGVTIAFKVGKPIALTVEHLASEAQAGGLLHLLSQYDVNLEPADPPQSEAPSVSITQTVGGLAQTPGTAPATDPAPQQAPPADAADRQLTPEQAILKALILEEVAVLIAQQSEQLSLWLARLHGHHRPLTRCFCAWQSLLRRGASGECARWRANVHWRRT